MPRLTYGRRRRVKVAMDIAQGPAFEDGPSVARLRDLKDALLALEGEIAVVDKRIDLLVATYFDDHTRGEATGEGSGKN